MSICVVFFIKGFLDNLACGGSGNSAHFSIAHVNHSNPTLNRTSKKIALCYKAVIEQHGLESDDFLKNKNIYGHTKKLLFYIYSRVLKNVIF